MGNWLHDLGRAAEKHSYDDVESFVIDIMEGLR